LLGDGGPDEIFPAARRRGCIGRPAGLHVDRRSRYLERCERFLDAVIRFNCAVLKSLYGPHGQDRVAKQQVLRLRDARNLVLEASLQLLLPVAQSEKGTLL
jgi:hypothetical protein